MQTFSNIFWLGTKELRSFMHDFVLLGLVIYTFSLAVIAQAQSRSQEVYNASIAIVDEDHSELSRRIGHAFLPPYFQPPQPIAERDIVPFMNSGKYTFMVDIPPNFQRDVLGGRQPAIQLNVDATTMVQAGLGSGYAQQIITTEINDFLSRAQGTPLPLVNLVVRAMLAIPIAGSIPLFMLGVAIYLFFATAVGIFLGTIARSMPQLGLLYLLVYLPMALLSGSNTPLESMPPWLATIMQASPSAHFVSFAQAILYRGAGFDVVWPQFLAVAAMGGMFFVAALLRFRRAAALTG
jgi:ABC-2 type transporter